MLPTARVPPRPIRIAQRLLVKAGRRDGTHALSGTGPARFLIRVDEFPHVYAFDEDGPTGTAAYERFHGAMRGIPYLVALLPRVAQDPLSPAGRTDRPLSDRERATIERLAREDVAFAQHALDHRTRFADPRRHSELLGLANDELARRLDRGLDELAPVRPRVFVPPYNRFEARHWPVLAERYDVICGGPETIALLGFQPGPSRLDGAVYFPSYAPFYERARTIAAALDRARGWTCLTLHWSWEQETDFADLARLLDAVHDRVERWDAFLAEVA